MVQDSSRHLLSLISDIIDVSKIEAGKIDIFREVFDITKSINEVKNSLQLFADKKKIDLIANLPKELYVYADIKRTKQILYNLINNAIKFTNKGTIEVFAEKTKNKVYISVKDTGVGITRTDLQKLFMPFSQVTSGEIQKQEGTGLGLFLSQKLVELNGGKMWAEGEFGKGSTFIFTLQIKEIGETTWKKF